MFKDGSAGGTPITAAELNRLGSQIGELTAFLNAATQTVALGPLDVTWASGIAFVNTYYGRALNVAVKAYQTADLAEVPDWLLPATGNKAVWMPFTKDNGAQIGSLLINVNGSGKLQAVNSTGTDIAADTRAFTYGACWRTAGTPASD